MIKFALFILFSGCFVYQSLAGDETDVKNEWLANFLKSELTVATVNIDQESEEEIPFSAQVKVHFDFGSKIYSVSHYITYKKNWDELTNGGNDVPPKMKSKLIGSAIIPWTNINGVGVYEERLTKEELEQVKEKRGLEYEKHQSNLEQKLNEKIQTIKRHKNKNIKGLNRVKESPKE